MLTLQIISCSGISNEQTDIIRSLEIRTRALNARDIHGYTSVISDSYFDKGKNALLLKTELARTLGACEQMQYIPADRTISLHGTRAEVVGTYRMRISVHGRGLTINGTEHLTLGHEPGGWKIIAGL